MADTDDKAEGKKPATAGKQPRPDKGEKGQPAQQKAQKAGQEQMGKLTGGLPLPFKLPF